LCLGCSSIQWPKIDYTGWSAPNIPGLYNENENLHLDSWRNSAQQLHKVKREQKPTEFSAGTVGILDTGRPEKGKIQGALCKNRKILHVGQRRLQKQCTSDECRRKAQKISAL
jgi:hypothetical protein